MHERLPNSISRKLTLMNLLVSAAALLLAGAAFLIYDQIAFREDLVLDLSAQAQIIGSTSVSALTFNDPQTATKTLSALANTPNIRSAGIITADGRIFATYSRSGTQEVVLLPPVPPGEVETAVFRDDEVVLVRSIKFQDTTLGSVYIRSGLEEMRTRLRRYIMIVLGVLFISLIAALLVSHFFQKRVAQPIIELAATARAVSRDKNYSVRATPAPDRSELSVLIDAFNEMLTQIQQRDLALQEAQNELEQRVEDRTRQLVASNKELEAFSYTVSHDLRGPLDALTGFSHILITDYSGRLDDKGRTYLNELRVLTRRMAELIEDLLNLSRVTSTAMHNDRVDLSALARSIADEFRQHDPARRVEFSIAPGAVAIGDARLIRIVLENLLRNSWKYTSLHENACIEFGWRRRDGQIVCYVRDDGAGFDQRFADRLFRPFQRLHSTAEFPGTGIGLATVQRIVHRHGGDVWAEGAVEQGATFYFTLRAADHAHAPSA